ncbi:MAG: DUF3850 domain-containing protein [Patescibacteria group bacterium]|nr:MAG: DUF3850 domain-containing protein [Patescibacteria group bacterium]
MIIEKKTWPEQFEALVSGIKKFDCRLADFNCQVGDTLVLKEWDPITAQYTGRQLEKHITYILRTKEAPFWNKEEIEEFGLQIISLE